MTTDIASREAELHEFIARCHEALTYQKQRPPQPFLDLWSAAEDVTIMAVVGDSEVGFERVSALLTWASKVQSFDGSSAETLVTSGPGRSRLQRRV
ncbi:MAG: hypothetical protein JO368_10915 [Acidimicrobiales bacterium]|nr:hypothetical protein [Acidimicrobiales bacterium]